MFQKKHWTLFKSKGAKKKRTKKFGKIGKKVRVDGPRQKKVPNFPIFWPIYHKRLATPAIQYTVYTIQYTVYSIQYTLYSIHYTVYSIHYTVYTIQYTLYTIHYTLYSIQYTLYSIHYTLYTIHYTLYSQTSFIRGPAVVALFCYFSMQ